MPIRAGYAAVLSAQHQFRGLNVARAALGISGYLVPLLVASFINRLDALVASILVLRVVTLLVAWRACQAHLRFSFSLCLARQGRHPGAVFAGRLGWHLERGWPDATYLDRMIIGSLVPIRMVAFYAVPFDLASRTLILPYSLVGALFPTVAAVERGTLEATRRLGQSMRLLFVLIFPLVFGLVVLARPGLRIWLGEEFAAESALVL